MTEHRTARAALARHAATDGEVAAELFRTAVAVETKTENPDVVTEADRAAQRRVAETIAEEFPDEMLVGEESDALIVITANRCIDGVERRRFRGSHHRHGWSRRDRLAVISMKAIPETGTAWVVDPIDGTNDYVRELQTWATAVACVVDSEPVAAANALPALDAVYTADGEGAYRNGHSVEVTETTDSERATITPTIRWERNRCDEYARACQAIVKRFGDLRRPGCAQCALANLAAGSVEGVITNGRTNPWDIVAGVHLVRQAGGTVTDLEGERWRHDDRGLDELLAVVRAIDTKPSLSRAR